MNIKQIIKRKALFYNANLFIKAWLQERKSHKELFFYSKKFPNDVNILNDNDIVSKELELRLTKRSIQPQKKKKGDLNIFLTYSLNNWEAILPIVLGPFGSVFEFEWGKRGFIINSNKWLYQREEMNKEMLKVFLSEHKKRPFDVVVGYLSGYSCDPSILRQMGDSGAIIVNFCWDDKLGFRGRKIGGRWTGPASLVKVVDLNLTNSPESRLKYFGEGGLSLFWPEAAHPEIHKPYNLPFKYDVTMVGGKYGYRPIFIKKLKKLGIDVVCFGNGWENGQISDEEMIKIYSQSRINIGFSGVGYSKKLVCLKGRDFEVPMSQGLYLTQDNPELSLVYDVGKEIVTYRDVEDCAQKIKWLLANPSIADNIRKAGRERAILDHSWDKRFQDVFSLAGIL